jgi:hypothetical protein
VRGEGLGAAKKGQSARWGASSPQVMMARQDVGCGRRKEMLTLRGPASSVKSASYSLMGRIVTGHGFVVTQARGRSTRSADNSLGYKAGRLLTIPERQMEASLRRTTPTV